VTNSREIGTECDGATPSRSLSCIGSVTGGESAATNSPEGVRVGCVDGVLDNPGEPSPRSGEKVSSNAGS